MKKEARRFKVRVILKGCHQVSPDGFVTHFETKDAVIDFGTEVGLERLLEELEGVEVLEAIEEGVTNGK